MGGNNYSLYDIAQFSDLSIEELSYCSYEQLVDIVLDYLYR